MHTTKIIRKLGFLLLLFLSVGVSAQEICDNGIDDDGDNLVDINDDDCECTGFGNSQNLSSLIPNSSFEDRSCCPTSYTQLNCADTWIQASNPTSDYWHTCGTAGSSFDGMAAQPIPDGGGFVGFITQNGWQEYVGACLVQPMVAGNTYDLTFFVGYTNNSPSFDLTFYGTPNCGDLPFSGNDCPTGQGGWFELGSTNVGGSPGWEEVSVSFTPGQDINALVIGGACGIGGSRKYFYLDDLSLVSTELFAVLDMERTGRWCDNDVLLTATKDTALGNYQWYKNGIALVGGTSDNLDVSGNGYGAGEYAVALFINGQCEQETVTVEEAEQPTADAARANECFPDSIDFTDQSAVNNANITAWDWDFGDGNSSNLQNPQHAYASDGTYDVELTVTTDSNCTATWQSTVTVYPKPDAIIGASDQCLYDDINFDDLSDVNVPDNITGWEWNFGDGNSSNVENPSNAYTSEGIYDIELMVETNNGCRDTATTQIELFAVPSTGFAFDSVCAEATTTFTDTSSISTGTISAYDWDFADGNSSTLQNPTHVYTNPSVYNVELVSISDEGCRDSITQSVPVYPNPIADFDDVDACFNDSNIFTDQSSVVAGSIDEWTWDFGDGDTSTEQSPNHAYAASGPYDVTLTVTTNNGCTADTTMETEVHDLPEADCTITDVCQATPASITDNSTIPSGNIDDWFWDFGDGNTTILPDPPDYLYNSADTFDVTLIVTSGNSCADTLIQQVEIYPMPEAEFDYHNSCLGVENQFTDLSQVSTGAVDSWVWDFGDGNNSNLQDPTNTYNTHGPFQVSLDVETDNGCTDRVIHEVIVHPLPEVDFDYTDVCLNEETEFFDQSTIYSGNLNRWVWDYDDGNGLVAQNTTHTYAQDGIYDVTLVVTSDSSCVDSISQDVTVFPLPEVDFNADVVEGCQPLRVNFTDLSSVTSGSVSQWTWQFGNGGTSTDQFPENIYGQDGIFSVTLDVKTNEGCASTFTWDDMITVYPVPYASFTAAPQPTTIVYPWVEFTDGSSNDVLAWDWDFADGAFSTLQNPEHEYQDTGTYPVELIVTNQYDCRDTSVVMIRIDGDFTFYVPSAFTPNNDGTNDYFYGSGIGISRYEMRIFNRWGELVFFSANMDDKWDGTVRDKIHPSQNEVYVYRFDITDLGGDEHTFTGRVTLVR